MMRALPAVVLAAALAAPAFAAPPATPAPADDAEHLSSPLIHWHPVGEELVLADREGKPILYFFTADWCGPCHQLKSTLFADAERSSQIAASFVPVVVQDTRVETGRNEPAVDAAIRRYGVRSLPTLVVALPDGSEVSRQNGFAGADRAWDWLKQQAQAAEQRLEDR